MKKWVIFLLALILVLPACTGEPASSDSGSDGLYVKFVDVGQADFILIKQGDHAMAIDGGNVADGQKVYSVLRNEASDGLEYYVGTHCHEDHMGASASVVTAVGIGKVYCPVTEGTQVFFRNFKTKLGEKNLLITVPTPGESFSLGNAMVQILGPISIDADDPNNTSIVIKLAYKNKVLIFTGDAEREEEGEILSRYSSLNAEFSRWGIMVAHPPLLTRSLGQ